MVISEAVKLAMEQGGMIYRKGIWSDKGFSNVFIRPTNSYDNCIVVKYQDGKEKSSCRNWNPTAEDLMADDWELWNKLADKFSDA